MTLNRSQPSVEYLSFTVKSIYDGDLYVGGTKIGTLNLREP